MPALMDRPLRTRTDLSSVLIPGVVPLSCDEAQRTQTVPSHWLTLCQDDNQYTAGTATDWRNQSGHGTIVPSMEQPGVVVWGDICPGMQDFDFKDAVYALSPYMIPFTLHSGACKHLLSEAPLAVFLIPLGKG